MLSKIEIGNSSGMLNARVVISLFVALKEQMDIFQLGFKQRSIIVLPTKVITQLVQREVSYSNGTES